MPIPRPAGLRLPQPPHLLFGFMGVTAGIVNLRLPETRGQPLPEEMDDLLRMLNEKGRKGSKEKLAPVTSTQYSVLAMQDESSESEDEINNPRRN